MDQKILLTSAHYKVLVQFSIAIVCGLVIMSFHEFLKRCNIDALIDEIRRDPSIAHSKNSR
jgi:hypothetical protein